MATCFGLYRTSPDLHYKIFKVRDIFNLKPTHIQLKIATCFGL